MNKEIEEIMLTIPQKIVAYNGDPKGQHLYGEQRQQIAETLYNAGYRKVERDEKCSLLKIEDLCIEFDEMGYEPTSLCEDPEKEAKKWKQNLMNAIGLLLDESTAITARYNELKAENETLKSEKEGWKKRFKDSGERNKKLSMKNARFKNLVKEFAKRLKTDPRTTALGLEYVAIVDIDAELNELLKEYEK